MALRRCVASKRVEGKGRLWGVILRDSTRQDHGNPSKPSGAIKNREPEREQIAL
jgi:hypothetical protein